MLQSTIAHILDDTLERESEYNIYLVRDGEIVFYIGKSSNIYERLAAHMGLDWRESPSVLGRCIHNNLPQSRTWTVELYSIEDCEQVTIEYFQRLGMTWYTKETYYSTGGAVDLAEKAMIALHRPHLNTIYSTKTNRLPERYQPNLDDTK